MFKYTGLPFNNNQRIKAIYKLIDDEKNKKIVKSVFRILRKDKRNWDFWVFIESNNKDFEIQIKSGFDLKNLKNDFSKLIRKYNLKVKLFSEGDIFYNWILITPKERLTIPETYDYKYLIDVNKNVKQYWNGQKWEII